MNLIIVSHLPTEFLHASHPVSHCARGQIISLSLTGAVRSEVNIEKSKFVNLSPLCAFESKRSTMCFTVFIFSYLKIWFVYFSFVAEASCFRLTSGLMIVVKIASAYSELI